MVDSVGTCFHNLACLVLVDLGWQKWLHFPKKVSHFFHIGMEVLTIDPGRLVVELIGWLLQTPGAPSQNPEQGKRQGEESWSTVRRREQAHLCEEPLKMAFQC